MQPDPGQKVLVATRLSRSERGALARLAEANDRPLSREVRRAILRHLAREQAADAEEAGAS